MSDASTGWCPDSKSKGARMRDYMPHPARLWSLIEAAAAAMLMFLPVTQNETAAILAVFAVLTGERVVRVVKKT